jgi:hypothetical protein
VSSIASTPWPWKSGRRSANTGRATWRTRTTALDVVELLGWIDFEKFQDDMMLLA